MPVEAAPVPKHLIVDHPDNVPLCPDTSRFRAKVANIGNEYLRGRSFPLQCVPLRGFQSWRTFPSPPLKRRRLSPKDSKPSRASGQLNTSGKCTNLRVPSNSDAITSTVEDTRAVKDDLRHGAETKLPHSLGGSPTVSRRVQASTQHDLPAKTKSSGDRKKTETNLSAEQTALNYGVRTIKRGHVEAAEDERSLKTQAGTKQGETRSRLVGVDVITSPAAEKHPTGNIDPSQTTAIHDTPALARRRQRGNDKPSLKRTCTWCGTEHSYQWRKGPTGPATLCSRCGAKWTHQQKKWKEQVDIDSKARQRPRTGLERMADFPRAEDRYRSTANHPLSDRNHKLVPLVKDETSAMTHTQICRQLFPNIEIRRAILANQATKLEDILAGEVLLLRGKPSPMMQNWDETPHESNTVLRPSHDIMKLHDSASPHKRVPKSGHKTASKKHGNAGIPKSTSKKRKMLNFDTPQASDKWIANVSPSVNVKLEAQPPSHGVSRLCTATTPAHEPRRLDNHDSSRSGEHHGSSQASHIKSQQCVGSNHISRSGEVDTGGVFSSRRSGMSNAQVSTQAALLQAQEAFQTDLNNLDRDVTNSHESATIHLLSPPTTRALSESSDINLAHISTQDLFDQTLDFGSPSPDRKPPVQTTRSNATTAVPEQNPTSPPASSQPDFDFQTDVLVRNGNLEPSTDKFTGGCRSSRGNTPSKSDHCRRSSPPLFSSSTKLSSHPQGALGFPRLGSQGSCDYDIDVDGVLAEAGSFLDTWKT